MQLFSPDLREDYFETIDTEYKAYFLGLIMTDGCVHNAKGKQPLLSITLQESDSYLLDAFKNDIQSNKMVTHDGRGCCELNIISTEIVKDLRKYNIIPNKSLHTIFPQNIPEHLYNHFIRGLIDGDGSISYYSRSSQGRKSHTKAVRFCQGNKQFIEDMVDFLYSNVKIAKVNTYQEKDNLWSIAYRKNDSILKLIKYMYDDAHIYMERKKLLCDLVYAEAYKYGNTEITKKDKEFLVS